MTGGRGVDVAFETAGTEITAGQLIEVTHKGGTIVFVGYSGKGSINLLMNMALDKELTLKTIFPLQAYLPDGD